MTRITRAIRSTIAAVLVAALILAPAAASGAVYGKQIGGGGGGGTTITTAAPATGNGSGGSPVSVQAASGSQSGYLSSADWTVIHSLATVATSGLISDLAGTLNIARIGANSITLTKLVTMSAGAFWCNPTGSPASGQECTFGSGLSLSGLGVLTASGGGGLTVTGTGVVHATSGTVDGAALPVYIPKAGTAFGDNANPFAPGSDAASQYLAAVAETANRANTVNTTGSPPLGMQVRVVRTSSAAFTRTIVNGGPAGGNLCVFPASQTSTQACVIQWNNTDWIFVAYQFVTF